MSEMCNILLFIFYDLQHFLPWHGEGMAEERQKMCVEQKVGGRHAGKSREWNYSHSQHFFFSSCKLFPHERHLCSLIQQLNNEELTHFVHQNRKDQRDDEQIRS